MSSPGNFGNSVVKSLRQRDTAPGQTIWPVASPLPAMSPVSIFSTAPDGSGGIVRRLP
eukprot:CAMPEP_0180760434 /NCGR_PEP_ID=MMETSP1038_2-20121128/36311_1 /TAXON_ID=632150 /ORGANISM="Azadinium spinosum, Strain 3D9" /LENGTH=57 /DNA_ID=CAMNT_0022794581 /DNA_START=415 /DNA_END=584 /DNA_ORIENTATION=+